MYLVRTSIDNKKDARALANTLVSKRFAVSAHIRTVDTVYEWEGEMVTDDEWEVEFLTNNPEGLCEYVRTMHNYVVPEMIIIDINLPEDNSRWVNSWCDTSREIGVDQL